jgi:hypothetical protein
MRVARLREEGSGEGMRGMRRRAPAPGIFRGHRPFAKRGSRAVFSSFDSRSKRAVSARAGVKAVQGEVATS